MRINNPVAYQEIKRVESFLCHPNLNLAIDREEINIHDVNQVFSAVLVLKDNYVVESAHPLMKQNFEVLADKMYGRTENEFLKSSILRCYDMFANLKVNQTTFIREQMEKRRISKKSRLLVSKYHLSLEMLKLLQKDTDFLEKLRRNSFSGFMQEELLVNQDFLYFLNVLLEECPEVLDRYSIKNRIDCILDKNIRIVSNPGFQKDCKNLQRRIDNF